MKVSCAFLAILLGIIVLESESKPQGPQQIFGPNPVGLKTDRGHGGIFSHHSSHNSHEKDKISSCSRIRPMKRLQASQLLGVWYTYVSSADLDDASKKCLKINYKSIDNTTLTYEESYVNNLGETVGPTESSEQLGTTQGVIVSNETITLANGTSVSIRVSSVVVYTDYTKIQVQIVCGQMPDTTEIYVAYLVLVRNRSFNDLKPLLKALDRVEDADETQTIAWLNNDANTCKN